MKANLVVRAEDKTALAARVAKEVSRGYTTKYECFIIKVLMATSKTLEKQQDSVKRYMGEHARLAKQDDARDSFFPPIWKEAQRVFKLKPAPAQPKS
jgi:hypothetical protein